MWTTILFSVKETHIVVFGGPSSHGALVVGSIHHITSHLKETLLEKNTIWFQYLCIKFINLNPNGMKPFLLLLAFN